MHLSLHSSFIATSPKHDAQHATSISAKPHMHMAVGSYAHTVMLTDVCTCTILLVIFAEPMDQLAHKYGLVCK